MPWAMEPADYGPDERVVAGDVARAVGPGFAKARVHEAHQLAAVGLRLYPFGGQFGPGTAEPER